jgi:6-phosphogluconolactonase
VRLIATPDAGAAAAAAADEIAAACRAAVASRGRALIAVSGGETPWRMLERLRTLELPWLRIHVAQVDERIAPPGDPRRNLARLARILVRDGPVPEGQLLPMPVEAADVGAAAVSYQRLLEQTGGAPLQFDVVQLGLGTDGHTASLVPGDSALQVADRAVALSGEYQGLRRMTLTVPALNGARQRLWLVTGAAKAVRLAQLLNGDPASDVPALRVSREHTVVVADAEALTRTGRR